MRPFHFIFIIILFLIRPLIPDVDSTYTHSNTRKSEVMLRLHLYSNASEAEGNPGELYRYFRGQVGSNLETKGGGGDKNLKPGE